MPKGLYTASTVVLLESGAHEAAMQRALERFGPKGRLESRPSRWLGTACTVLAMPDGRPGQMLVDVVDEAWPDAMGNPKAEPDLFAAWVVGGFGPFVFPACLDRAVRHARRWPRAASLVPRHAAFARVRASQSLGGAQEAPILPEGYDPVAEMAAVTEVAGALLELPGAIAWFNPNGEVLLPAEEVRRSRHHDQQAGLPALDLWANVRSFDVEGATGWALVDTIGMEQVGVVDQEACFRPDLVDPDEVVPFLRELTLYILDEGACIGEGDTVEGPGGPWRAARHERSLAPAPRPTVRWSREGEQLPAALRA